MVTFSSEKVSPHITRITDGSDVCEYLIVGTKRAALIDTGYGIGDLKGYVGTLTDKPLDVFVTHGHVDHASGSGQFAKVWLRHEDHELAKEHGAPAFRKQMACEDGGLMLEDHEFIPQRTEGYAEIPDGMTVDLGEVTLTLLHIPGHTKGSIVPLIKGDRVLIVGDSCGARTVVLPPEGAGIKDYLEGLKKLKDYEPLYDTVLRQHGDFVGTKRMLADNIENCELILSRKDDRVPYRFMGMDCSLARKVKEDGSRADGGEGNICYLPMDK